MSNRFLRFLIFANFLLLVSLLLAALPSRPARAGYTVQSVSPQRPALALGTAFTYQGQLQQDGQPVSGACDFQFSLWDAASAGTQVGSTVDASAQAVSGGLFTASLDFGAGAFDGVGAELPARWLEVGVRCPAGGGSFAGLGRQALSPAPYALSANNAAALNGQPGSFYQARVGGACAIGSAIRSINADGSVLCQAAQPVFSRTAIDYGKGSVGLFTSFAIGADGLGLISYYDLDKANLKVAHCLDAICSRADTYTLDSDGDVGQYTSLAIGGDGLGLISYWDMANADLKIAHCLDAACSSADTYTLDSAGDVGWNTSLAIGADGMGLISYYDSTNGNLKVAHCLDVVCSIANTYNLDIDGNVGAGTSIAIGLDGLGLIGYYDITNGDLKVAHCRAAACDGAETYTLDDGAPNSGRYASIAIGGDGLGLISHYGGYGDLLVLHCDDMLCRP